MDYFLEAAMGVNPAQASLASLGQAFQERLAAEEERQRQEIASAASTTPAIQDAEQQEQQQQEPSAEVVALRERVEQLEQEVANLQQQQQEAAAKAKATRLLSPDRLLVESVSRPGSAAVMPPATVAALSPPQQPQQASAEELNRLTSLLRLRDAQLKEKMDAYDDLMREVVALRSQMQELRRQQQQQQQQPEIRPQSLSAPLTPPEADDLPNPRTTYQTQLRRQILDAFSEPAAAPQQSVLATATTPPPFEVTVMPPQPLPPVEEDEHSRGRRRHHQRKAPTTTTLVVQQPPPQPQPPPRQTNAWRSSRRQSMPAPLARPPSMSSLSSFDEDPPLAVLSAVPHIVADLRPLRPQSGARTLATHQGRSAVPTRR